MNIMGLRWISGNSKAAIRGLLAKIYRETTQDFKSMSRRELGELSSFVMAPCSSLHTLH